MVKVFELASHPKELKAAIRYKFFKEPIHQNDKNSRRPTLARCYELLRLTSRSFAAVIEELHPELRDAVMIFYLVLRALDTVEDDMSISPQVKVPLLRSFFEKLNLKEWSFDGNSEKEKDRVVLVEFNTILVEYQKIKPEYQDVIKSITRTMGNGMADFILDDNFNMNGVNSIDDYDIYCHYVAGIVGEGLTKLMVLAKFSDEILLQDNFKKSNSMGLFLQKTNIIRDYHEDLQDGRSFWPKEIWSNYTNKLASFSEDTSSESEKNGLACINHLVLNVLGHVKDVLTYLSLVKDPSCFSFCSIPQVMAIATLCEVYNNPKVLRGVVKIRKGTLCDLILNSRTLPGVVKIFRKYVREINSKSSVEDPNYLKVSILCGEIEQFCEMMYPTVGSIPSGATRTPNEIIKYVEERVEIDEKVNEVVQKENIKTNLVLYILCCNAFIILYKVLF